MAQVEKLGRQVSSIESTPESLREQAWREMLGGGVWAIIGAAIVAYAAKPPAHDILFILAAPPLLYGIVRFFHGLMRWTRV